MSGFLVLTLMSLGSVQAAPATDGGTATPSASQYEDQASTGATNFCVGSHIAVSNSRTGQDNNDDPKGACKGGYVAGFFNSPSKDDTCNDLKGTDGYGDRHLCRVAWDQGRSDGPKAREAANATDLAAAGQNHWCQGDHASVDNPVRRGGTISVDAAAACKNGYAAGFAGSPSKNSVCGSLKGTDDLGDKSLCQKAWDQGNKVGGNPPAAVTAAHVEADPDTPADPDATGDGADDDDACATAANGFGWILCPVINTVKDTFATKFQGFVTDNLEVKAPLRTDPVYKVWSNIRYIASALFLLVFLVIIFSTTLQVNLDAYAIKKIMPKLVIAAVLVQFSFVITQLIIDLGNVIAGGIPGLLKVAGNTATGAGHVSGLVTFLSTAVTAGLAVGIMSAVGIVAVIGIALAALTGFLSVFFVLIVRKLLIFVLIILAPLAFVAMILPNTESYFKMWYSNFTKMILMYPIIVLLFSAASLATSATQAPGGSSSNAYQAIIAAAFPIIACFMVPMTYKMSGSLMSRTAGAVSGATNRMGGKAKSGFGNSRFAQANKQNRAARKNAKLMDAINGEKGFIASRLPNRIGDKKAAIAKRWATGHVGRVAPGEDGGDQYANRQLKALKERDMHERESMLDGLGKDDMERMLTAAQTKKDKVQAMAIARKMLKNGQLEDKHVGALASMHGSAEEKYNALTELRDSDFGKFKANMVSYHDALSEAGSTGDYSEIGGISSTGVITIGAGTASRIQQRSAASLLEMNSDGKKLLKNSTKFADGAKVTVDGVEKVLNDVVKDASGNVVMGPDGRPKRADDGIDQLLNKSTKDTMMNDQNRGKVDGASTELFALGEHQEQAAFNSDRDAAYAENYQRDQAVKAEKAKVTNDALKARVAQILQEDFNSGAPSKTPAQAEAEARSQLGL